MNTSSIPGDVPISSTGEVQLTRDPGEVQAPDSGVAHIDSSGHISVQTPEYFVADTVGHLVDTVV